MIPPCTIGMKSKSDFVCKYHQMGENKMREKKQ